MSRHQTTNLQCHGCGALAAGEEGQACPRRGAGMFRVVLPRNAGKADGLSDRSR